MKQLSVLFLSFLFIPSLKSQRAARDCRGTLTAAASPASICYVLCDFSASQATTLDRIIAQAKTIFDKEGKEALTRYIAIGSASMEGTFFEYQPLEPKKVMTPIEDYTRKAYFPCMKARLDTALENLKRQTRYPNSCIINAIGIIASDLTNLAVKNEVVKIYILSDMMEDCNFRGKGKIDLARGDYRSALAVLDRLAAPLSTFQPYPRIKITLVGTSTVQGIDMQELNMFWRRVLAKYQYNFQGAISSSLPF
jgi:hypothetical protein